MNDNTGALEWAESHKCSSQSSLFAGMAVSQMHLLTDINIMEAVYLPGVQMGEIDAMSRRETHKDIESVCPSLLSSLFINLENDALLKLFSPCNPAAFQSDERDFHRTFLSIHHILDNILHLYDPIL